MLVTVIDVCITRAKTAASPSQHLKAVQCVIRIVSDIKREHLSQKSLPGQHAGAVARADDRINIKRQRAPRYSEFALQKNQLPPRIAERVGKAEIIGKEGVCVCLLSYIQYSTSCYCSPRFLSHLALAAEKNLARVSVP